MSSSSAIVPVILSGGVGTRLWPASRRLQPKQFLPLADGRSLLRATVDRAASVTPHEPPIIVTNADHADAIEREMFAAGIENPVLILEPVGRNTAPAVAVAAQEIISSGRDRLMVVLPSDHVIADEPAFASAIEKGAAVASAGYLVTFGITPSRPETGYGYIKVGGAIGGDAAQVAAFKEKPDRNTAESYLASGDYLWNSGMYLFAASRYLEELERYAPEIAEASREAHTLAVRERSRVALDTEAFGACPSDSIDYAVMEATTRAAVVPTDPGWNDIGSWTSLWDIGVKDDDGNVVSGEARLVDVSDSYIRGGNRLVAAIGVDNIIIVDTPDALLVASKEHAQDVKKIVDSLKSSTHD